VKSPTGVQGRSAGADRTTGATDDGPPTRVRESGPPAGQPASRRRRRRGDVVRRKLVVADVLGLVAAFAILQLWLGHTTSQDLVGLDQELILFGLCLPLWIVLARGIGLYSRDEERPEHTTADDLLGLIALVTISVWLLFVVSFLTQLANPDIGKWVAFWALAIGCVFVARALARLIARASPDYVQNAVIVGTDRTGQIVGRKLTQHPEFRINLVGFIDASPRELRSDLASIPVIGTADDLLEIADQFELDRVFVAFSGSTDRHMMQLARRLQLAGVQVDIVPRLFEALGPNAILNSLEGTRLVSLTPIHISRDALFLKRVMDIAISAIVLVLLAPVLLAIAVWVKLDPGGHVLFRQTRLGMDQHRFTALKFRSMRADTSTDAHRTYIREAMDGEATPQEGGLFKLERSDVVTRSGTFLRKTSLDELPQLLNVLRGDMSLVGPRPCIPYETEHFEEHHFERFSVPAGLTGLWQVKARGHSTFVEALELDVLYARSWSFWGDILLLLQTPAQVLRPKATS
jgi:exopolysaccharide biosynthesis polyprenyl glycosylphosphotransferase